MVLIVALLWSGTFPPVHIRRHREAVDKIRTRLMDQYFFFLPLLTASISFLPNLPNLVSLIPLVHGPLRALPTGGTYPTYQRCWPIYWLVLTVSWLFERNRSSDLGHFLVNSDLWRPILDMKSEKCAHQLSTPPPSTLSVSFPLTLVHMKTQFIASFGPELGSN